MASKLKKKCLLIDWFWVFVGGIIQILYKYYKTILINNASMIYTLYNHFHGRTDMWTDANNKKALL